MGSGDFAARARRAYELGRLRWSLRIGWIVLPLVVLSISLADDPTASIAVGVALLVTTVLCLWRGQMAGAAVGPGLIAGLIPFALLLALKCGSRTFCELGGGCAPPWLSFCGLGGLAAGLLLASHARRLHEGVLTFLLAGGAVAALTGLLGCFIGGLTGALWMALGELLATLPTFALQLRRR